MKRPAAFLDRDGTLNAPRIENGKSYPPKALKDFALLPNAAKGVQALKDNGFVTVVVTNQPDVARGWQPLDVVESMHAHLRTLCPIDAIYACYEEDGPDCLCYKPKPGMLLNAARDLNLDLTKSVMIGDRWRDIGAGKAAGCLTVQVMNPWDDGREAPDILAKDIFEAAKLIKNRI